MKTIHVGLAIALSTWFTAPMVTRAEVIEQEEAPEVPAADAARDEAVPPPAVEQPEAGGPGGVEAPPPVEQPAVEQ
jgi:hypothetical protein